MTIVIFLFFAMGICFHIIARLYAPWPDQYQKFFWIVTFGALILIEFLRPEHIFLSHGVRSFLVGLIFSEFFRPKINNWINKTKAKAQTPPELKKKMKSRSSKPKQ